MSEIFIYIFIFKLRMWIDIIVTLLNLQINNHFKNNILTLFL